MLRLFLLIRKLNELQKKRDAARKRKTGLGYSVTTPAERIIDILNELRERIPKEEDEMVNDLNFCIKMIGKGQIYEATLEMEEGGNKKA